MGATEADVRIRLLRFLNTCAVSVLIRYGAAKMGKERTENIGFNDKKGVDNEWCFPFKKRG